MSAVVWVLLMAAGFFILRPATALAKFTKARKSKVDPVSIPDDQVYFLIAIYAVVLYVTAWWILAVTGILAYLSKSLS